MYIYIYIYSSINPFTTFTHKITDIIFNYKKDKLSIIKIIYLNITKQLKTNHNRNFYSLQNLINVINIIPNNITTKLYTHYKSNS